MADTSLEKKQQTIPMSQLNDMGFNSGPAFALLRNAAEFISESDIIPKQFQKNISNCAVALNMARRMQADPVMVMQNLYVVYGRPGWSSQFLIATLNTNGSFSKLRYEWTAEKDKKKDGFGCRAYAVELDGGEVLYGPWVTVGLARSEGWYDRKSRDGGVASKWPTLTELMCMYRAAAFFVRTYCPEIAMGLRTADEEEEIHAARNVTSESTIINRTIDHPSSAGESADFANSPTDSPEPSDDKGNDQPAPETQDKPKQKSKAPADSDNDLFNPSDSPFPDGHDPELPREPGCDDD